MRSNKGVTITEFVIAIAILVVVIFAIMTYLRTIVGTQKTFNDMAVRDALVARIRTELSQPLSIRLSIDPMMIAEVDNNPGNIALANCIRIGGLCQAAASQANPVGFSLITRASGVPGAFDVREVARGGNPVPYSRDGIIDCDPNSVNPFVQRTCPAFLAETWFRAQCPQNTATCQKAQQINFFYQVRPGAALTEGTRATKDREFWNATDADGNLLRSVPRDWTRSPTVFRVSLLEQELSEICPIGARSVRTEKGSGVTTTDGQNKCECMRGWNPTFVDGVLTACNPPPNTACQCLSADNEPQRFMGFTEDGQIRCRSYDEIRYSAQQSDLDDSGRAFCLNNIPATCDPDLGAWVVNFNAGQCEVDEESDVKKGTVEREVICRNRQVTCGCFRANAPIVVRPACRDLNP